VTEATQAPGLVYTTATKVTETPSDALVLMCSDRRFQEAFREFLSTHLGLQRWDSIATPGGAYMLSFAEVLPKQLKVGTRMVKFMMQKSQPGRIIVINHEGCVRYLEAFHSQLSKFGFSLADKQRRDLVSVAKDLREAFPNTTVEPYYATLAPDGSCGFERL
jgi:hypothetical protein